MRREVKLENFDAAIKAIQSAKLNIEQNPEKFIVETFKAWTHLKMVVESIKEEFGKEPPTIGVNL